VRPGRGRLGSESISGLAGIRPHCQGIVLAISVQIRGVPDGLALPFKLSHCVTRYTRITKQECGKDDAWFIQFL